MATLTKESETVRTGQNSIVHLYENLADKVGTKLIKVIAKLSLENTDFTAKHRQSTSKGADNLVCSEKE
jgi:hypothetical protein